MGELPRYSGERPAVTVNMKDVSSFFCLQAFTKPVQLNLRCKLLLNPFNQTLKSYLISTLRHFFSSFT